MAAGKSNLIPDVLGKSKQQTIDSFDLMKTTSSLVQPWDTSTNKLTTFIKVAGMVNSDQVRESLMRTTVELLNGMNEKGKPRALFDGCTITSVAPGGLKLTVHCPAVMELEGLTEMHKNANSLHDVAASMDYPKFTHKDEWLERTSKMARSASKQGGNSSYPQKKVRTGSTTHGTPKEKTSAAYMYVPKE